MALCDHIKLVLRCLIRSDLALLITLLGCFVSSCLSLVFNSHHHQGIVFAAPSTSLSKWCLNFKLFSLQAGLQRFTGIMGTTNSEQARGKGPIIGSVRKTLLVIKFCLRFMNPVQWAWLGCLSVMGNLIISIFKWNLFQNRHNSAGPFIEIFGPLNNGWLLVNYWGGEAGLIIGMSSHVIPIFFTSVLWKSQVRHEQ